MKVTSKLKGVVAFLTATALLCSAAPFLPSENVYAAANCVIDAETEYQTIKGFGGMNHPEWAGDLTAAQRQTAFGNGANEIGMTICRIFVNDDKTQWSRALATAKDAQAKGALVFASPWNPPASMCETFTKSGDGDAKRLKKSSYAAYAQHLNDFVTYMKNNGVNLYCISIQNEPDWGFDWTWWTEDECVDFLANYASVIDCPVMSPESFSYRKSYYEKILANAQANANTDIWGTHFYGTSRDNMNFPVLENDKREIFMTEVYTDSKSDADVWPLALDAAENIHNGLAIGNMNAYVWWYIRRSYGPLKENGAISKRGYCMAQYSKFVRPGDIRIGATENPADKVFISAYKNDEDKITIVAINKNENEVSQNFDVSGGAISSIQRYRTSASENLALTSNITFSGSSFSSPLPANSVSTFVVDVSTGPVEPDQNGYYFHSTFEGNTDSWTGHGGATTALSGKSAYLGSEVLLVSGRTKAWNGAERAISKSAFEPGKAYSFSAVVMYPEGDATLNFFLKLQYTDASGETMYSSIAEATAVKGEYVQLANTSYTIPAGAKDMRVYVETESGMDNFYIDEAIGAVDGTKIDGPKGITFIVGDVDLDGAITSIDVAISKRGLLKSFSGSIAQKAADVDTNTVNDENDIKQHIAFVLAKQSKFTQGEIPTPPVEPVKTVTPDEYMSAVNAKIVNSEPSDAVTEKSGIAYGKYEKKTIFSTVCNRNKSFNVLLPANYSTSKKYPVMYVLHGYWGDEDALLDSVDASLKLRQIIGNAIASGEAEDMICVFPDIYASATQDKCSGLDANNNAAYDNFINLLTKEIMPYMEKNYPIKTGRDNTAITGFSMGGRESLYIGFARPDLFGYVGAMCPAPGLTSDLIKSADLKFTDSATNPYLLLISAGSNDTLIYSTPAGYHDTLNNNKVTHIWHYVNGGDHGGKTIRPHMYNFVRAVFKAA